MAESGRKITLIHGDCDYLIFKELKAVKKELSTQGVSTNEIFGAKGVSFDQINIALSSSDLFLNTSAVIVRDLMDSRSFFPFVEELTEFIQSGPESENLLFLIHSGKILKTSRLYKAVAKAGEVRELNQPKPAEIRDMIHKSINITNDAALLLIQFTGSNLFQIKNEIEKLKNYLLAKNKDRVDIDDIEEVCIKVFSQTNIWGIGGRYLNYKLETGNNKNQLGLLEEISDLLLSNVAVMQIIYSFYQYILNAIKFKLALDEGKITSERDAFSYGYFFVKEFYAKRGKFDIDKLMKWNSEILNIEFQIKRGEMDEELGLKRLVLGV